MEEDYDFRAARQPEADMDLEEPRKSKKPLRVVDHPNTQKAQVVVIEPRAFEEALEIIEHLRAKKSVILNLHLLDTAQSQRVVDFLSGATHAIDGNQQRIGDGVFIFTPNNVSIRSEAEKTMAIEDAYWKQSY
jgi:cell division inhibitor SepF